MARADRVALRRPSCRCCCRVCAREKEVVPYRVGPLLGMQLQKAGKLVDTTGLPFKQNAVDYVTAVTLQRGLQLAVCIIDCPISPSNVLVRLSVSTGRGRTRKSVRNRNDD